jgi:hypothetical protein
MDTVIERIYKEQQLAMYVRDYKETDNDETKTELYEKIRLLLIELMPAKNV